MYSWDEGIGVVTKGGTRDNTYLLTFLSFLTQHALLYKLQLKGNTQRADLEVEVYLLIIMREICSGFK